jgi:DNA-binding MarR family transcriptional regulator
MESLEKPKVLLHYFLREKPVMMLVKLRNTNKPRYASLLAKEVDCTYSHTVRILQILEKNDLIKFVKRGRIKIIELTKLGERISAIMEELVREFNKAND